MQYLFESFPKFINSLLITVAFYCAFPLIFAAARKKIITEKKYRIICFCFNILIMFFFAFINESAVSCVPYALWTLVFSSVGIKILKNKEILEDPDAEYNTPSTTPSSYYANKVTKTDTNLEAEAETEAGAETPIVTESKPEVRFCRECGFKLIAGSEFCSECGTAVEKE